MIYPIAFAIFAVANAATTVPTAAPSTSWPSFKPTANPAKDLQVEILSRNWNNPGGIALDDSDSNHYYLKNNAAVLKFDVRDNTYLLYGGNFGNPDNTSPRGDGGQATSASVFVGRNLAVKGGAVYLTDSLGAVRTIANNGIITKIIGTYERGYYADNGPGTSASIFDPAGIAVDAAGNVYVSDLERHNVRKLTASDGIIRTFCGSAAGSAGINNLEDVAATSINFFYTHGLYLDESHQRLYIASLERIKYVDLTTNKAYNLAGSPPVTSGGDGGPATSAGLRRGMGISGDGNGNIYFTDDTSSVIRKVDFITGIITRYAGVADGSVTTSYVSAFTHSFYAAPQLFFNQSTIYICAYQQIERVYNQSLLTVTKPTFAPTNQPTAPTVQPTRLPTVLPSRTPTVVPSALPSATPSATPSTSPSQVPTQVPSAVPSATPSITPSQIPSVEPSVEPSSEPSVVPSVSPSSEPSQNPTVQPSAKPTRDTSGGGCCLGRVLKTVTTTTVSEDGKTTETTVTYVYEDTI